MNAIMTRATVNDFIGIKDRLIDAVTGKNISEGMSSIRIRSKIRCVGSDGSVLNTQNCTIYGGRRFILESICRNIPKASQCLTLNTILNINEDITPANAELYLNRAICLVGVGDGGATTTFGQVYDAKSNDNNLFNIVPLRTVPVGADLSAAERLVYFMRKRVIINSEAYYQYFLKKVANSEIYAKHQNVNYTPTIADNDPEKDSNNPLSLYPIQTFTTFAIPIADTDVKEHYQVNEGTLKSARFNELALYYGIPTQVTDAITGEVYTDYIGVEAFSKLTFNNRPMDNEGSKYDFVYYIIT